MIFYINVLIYPPYPYMFSKMTIDPLSPQKTPPPPPKTLDFPWKHLKKTSQILRVFQKIIFWLLGQKSKFGRGRSPSRHVENVHTNFHANWTNNKASFPQGARPLQNPSMVKFAHFSRNSGHTGLSWFSIFWKTYRARNMIFWLKVDQICGNNRTKTAIQIFDFLPPKNFQKLIFLIFYIDMLIYTPYPYMFSKWP